MVEQLLNHIEKHVLCTPSDKLLLAVSGGLDSMVMLHLFHQLPYNMAVAHVNFQLRGDESEGDEKFVRDHCQQLGIPFFGKKFETEAYAKEGGLSIQMAARELRYDWFDQLTEEHGFTVVATAHHLNDSIETVLMNWMHGQSAEGFTGIPVRNGKIIRPLLFATRLELEQYAHQHEISWREDSSNLRDDYQRNLIRHSIVPKLKALNFSLERTVEQGLDKVRGELMMMEAFLEEWKAHHVVHANDKILIAKSGLDSYLMAPTILWKLLRHLGFSFDMCRQTVNVMHAQPGKKFMGPVHTLVIDRDHLVVYPNVDFWQEVSIEKGTGRAILGSWNLTLTEGDIGIRSGWKDHSPYEARLDASMVRFPLRWRQWKEGDVFYPLGMDHRKKVSDLLIDNKISMADKSRVTVLESDGNIIWVVGQRIDNRYKITEQTRQVLTLTVTPYFI